MSLCHCQKSACCICGLSAQNCSCVGIKAQPPPRPSSAAPRVPPRPSSAAQRCIKCTELAAQLSKAHALSACHAERQAIWERELALARAATSDAHAALQAEQEARARIAAELEELRREHALKADDHEDREERERTLHKTIIATTKARDTAEQKERKVRGARADTSMLVSAYQGASPHARTHARTHPSTVIAWQAVESERKWRAELVELRRSLATAEKALAEVEDSRDARQAAEVDARGELEGRLRAELAAVELERDAYRKQLQEALVAVRRLPAARSLVQQADE